MRLATVAGVDLITAHATGWTAARGDWCVAVDFGWP
jgi:hypothetical protein